MILILYPFHFFQKFLSFFPLNWHYLHAFVDSFQGCYKDGTKPGTFNSRWFSTTALLIRLFCFIICGTTLSMMYFVYSLITFIILLITVINIQPFKKVASCYPSTDTVFHILLSLVLTGCTAGDIPIRENFASDSILTLTLSSVILIAFVPLVYIALLISFWLISRMR